MQSPTAVTAYFPSGQLLPFAFVSYEVLGCVFCEGHMDIYTSYLHLDDTPGRQNSVFVITDRDHNDTVLKSR